MVMLKISAFLAAYVLVICHMYCSHAAPVRPGLESVTDQVMLSNYEAQRLLNAIMKEFVEMTVEELDQQESDGNSSYRSMSKRCSNLSTCVLGKLSQELQKLQVYQHTDVGASTPGRKRNLVESDGEPNHDN